MDLHDRLKSDAKAFHLYVGTDSETWDQATGLQRTLDGGIARIVRGRKSLTPAAFFDEVAAALQFPYYFGENWDAFNDCVTDLEWLPANSYAVIITHAVHLLEKENGEALKHFVTVFQHAAKYWHKPGKGKKPKALHVVLHATPEEASSLKTKWHGLGVTLAEESRIED
jgi:RNAse (barnase) inhibitor barstar